MAEHLKRLYSSRWLVMVAAMWVQTCAGVGYAFGSYSPVIKSVLGYNQKQINRLGVAKDIGDSVGLFAGILCDVLPLWSLFLLGSLQNLIGYGWLWLITEQKTSPVPFWMMCALICIGTNGETYFNTGALVACVKSFPNNRGGIVGILKGLAGLSGAIFTQIYTAFYAPDQAAFIFVVAVGPAMVAIFVMLIIRPVIEDNRDENLENNNFSFLYSVCLALAAYLMGAMLIQDFVGVSYTVNILFAGVLFLILIVPLALPIRQAVLADSVSSATSPAAEDSLKKPLVGQKTQIGYGSFSETRDGLKHGTGTLYDIEKQKIFTNEKYIEFSEMEDEKMKEELPEPLRRRKLQRMSSQLFRAVAEGAVKVKRRKGPHRGEDFTLRQALVKADFWLLFLALLCGGGTGLTAIDNLGQMGQSQGYSSAHIFVSLISIWNFLGRVGAGYLSEIIARKYALPRPILMAAAQAVMAVGHLLFALAWPGSMYFGSLLVGLAYGAHWSIIPATASELFGLKSFGVLYNVLTTALPAGSLIFSGLVAGTIYDMEAAKQTDSSMSHVLGGLPSLHDDDVLSCEGSVCFELTFFILTGICIIGVLLNLVLISRTRRVYKTLYGRHVEDARSRSMLHSTPLAAKKEASSSETR